MADPWPLSAAQTLLLRDPRTSGNEVLTLALEELILAGAWRLTREPRAPSRWQRSDAGLVVLRRGPGLVPRHVPLPLLHERLLAVIGEGDALGEAVRRLVASDSRVASRLRQHSVDDLVARGLLVEHRSRALGLVPHTRVAVTPSGASWDRAARERQRQLSAGAPAGALGSAGGLLLMLDEDAQRLVDEQVRRADDAAPFADLADMDGLPGIGAVVQDAVGAWTTLSGDGGDAGGAGD